jgi:DNA-binding CsgD family transcriptional regulator
MGWDNFAYVAHVPTRFVWKTHALMVTNYPVRWIFNYMRKGFYKIDPLANYCQSHNLGMVWTTDLKDWANYCSKTKEIVAMARREGWIGGVAIPIPAVPCRGTFALMTRQPLAAIEDMLETALLLGPTIGLHIHDALLNICLNSKYSVLERGSLYLTDLEKDILQLTAEGMPGKQVASHLELSAKAVERHLEKMRVRLKTPNRAKLLVMGYALGLINTARVWEPGSVINADGYEDRLEKVMAGEVKISPDSVNDYLFGDISVEDL